MTEITAKSIDDVVLFFRKNISGLKNVTKDEVVAGFKKVGDGTISWWEKQKLGTKILIIIAGIEILTLVVSFGASIAFLSIVSGIGFLIDLPITLAMLGF